MAEPQDVQGAAVTDSEKPPLEADCTFHSWPIQARGGQHAGVSHGVLVVHQPTGLAAFSVDQRSQMQNRKEALRLLATAKAGRADTERVQALEGERYWHFKLYDEDDGFNGPTIQTPDGNFDTVRAAIDHIVSVRSGRAAPSETNKEK